MKTGGEVITKKCSGYPKNLVCVEFEDLDTS